VKRRFAIRFSLLPYANDPVAFPDSNWATSYHCDVCGCADYDQTYEGKDIMPFYRDNKNGDLVCETCKESIP
jgi:hypothetical protein